LPTKSTTLLPSCGRQKNKGGGAKDASAPKKKKKMAITLPTTKRKRRSLSTNKIPTTTKNPTKTTKVPTKERKGMAESTYTKKTKSKGNGKNKKGVERRIKAAYSFVAS
jgi:hypothetical protein